MPGSESITGHLRCEVQGGYATITLNRPERLNALTHELLVDLRALLQEMEADRQVRAVVLTGAGRAFSSGADLSGGPSDTEEVLRTYYNPLVTDLLTMRTPLIAAVNGLASGAGFALALACDLRVAGQSAWFQLPFVKVGLVPDAGSSWLLPRTVGTGRAAELALLGRRTDAVTALAWNLVNEVVSDADLLRRAADIASEIAGLSSSVAATRTLLHSALQSDLAAHLDAEARAQGEAQSHPDYSEARAAFRDKRPPRFSRGHENS